MQRLARKAMPAFAAAFVAAAAYAMGAQTSSNTVIRACVDRHSGAIRLRGSHACHRRTERALSWNQRGPIGATGPAGAGGAAGGTGLTGVQGPKGDTGATGPAFIATKHNGPSVSDPPANPDEAIATARTEFEAYSVTLPSDGKYYVRFFDPALGETCAGGSARAGLYSDGVPVAGTSRDMPDNAHPQTLEWTALLSMTAGAHELSLQVDCPAGSLNTGVYGTNTTWTVMLTG